MPLKCIQLENWQNHERRIVHFDPACTVLVGPNGSGKSAIIRALEWVLFNTWEGKADGFIRWGAESATVRLWTDRHVIRRHKGGSKNLYALDGVEIQFDSVNRRTVPEVITTAHLLSQDNFQGQLDSAFWFSLTPGEVVRSLNKIVNLEEIDASLSRAKSKVSEAKSREKLTQERLVSAQLLTESLAWTLKAHQNMCTIEQVHVRAIAISARIAATDTCIRAIQQAERVRDNAVALIAEGRAVLDLHQSVVGFQRRANAIQSVLDQLARQDQRRAMLAQQIANKREQYRELEQRLVNICTACGQPLPE